MFDCSSIVVEPHGTNQRGLGRVDISSRELETRRNVNHIHTPHHRKSLCMTCSSVFRSPSVVFLFYVVRSAL